MGNISPSDKDDDILIEVFDDDFGKENKIGEYILPLKKAILNTDKEADWYTIKDHSKTTGKISLSTFYSPDDDQDEEKKEKGVAENESFEKKDTHETINNDKEENYNYNNEKVSKETVDVVQNNEVSDRNLSSPSLKDQKLEEEKTEKISSEKADVKDLTKSGKKVDDLELKTSDKEEESSNDKSSSSSSSEDDKEDSKNENLKDTDIKDDTKEKKKK